MFFRQMSYQVEKDIYTNFGTGSLGATEREVKGGIVIMFTTQFRTSIFCFVLLLFVALPVISLAAPGDLDTVFAGTGKLSLAAGGGADEANAVARQSDGKLVAAGTSIDYAAYPSVTSIILTRYNADGTLDITFGIGGKVSTAIGTYTTANGIVITPAGKILITGSTSVSGGHDFVVVQYLPNGAIDTSFGGGDGIATTDMSSPSDAANDVVLQSDGKIVVGGTAGPTSCGLARYNADGSRDTSFGPGGLFNVGGRVITSIGNYQQCTIKELRMQGTKILAAGYAKKNSNNNPDPVLIRYDASGFTDSYFGSTGIVVIDDVFESYVYSLDLQTTLTGEEKIIIAGSVRGDGTSRSVIALWRFDQANGALDTSFGTGGRATLVLPSDSAAREVRVQTRFGSAYKIVVGGYHNGGYGRTVVARFLLTGAPDTSFDGDGYADPTLNSNAYSAGNAMVLESQDNKVVVVGRSKLLAEPGVWTDQDTVIARYTATGSLDPSFDVDGIRTEDYGNGSSSSAGAVAAQADGKVIVAGGPYMVRLTAAGGLDASYDFDGKVKTVLTNITAAMMQSDGKLLIAGSMSGIFAIARYNTNGSIDTSFSGDGVVTSSGGAATAIAIQPDGKIVAVGSAWAAPYRDFVVVRCNTDGTLDTSFNTYGSASTPIGASTDDVANAVVVRADGKIILAGQSLVGPGNYDIAVVRYLANGSLDTTFNDDGIATTSISGGSDIGMRVTTQSGNKILVAGTWGFTPSALALVRYNDNGLRDATFDGDGILTTLPFGSLDAFDKIIFQSNGKILAVGYDTAGTGDRNFAVVRYNANGTLDTTYSTDGIVNIDINGDDAAHAIALDSTGKALVAGEAGGRFGVVRITGDGVPRGMPDGTLSAAADPGQPEWQPGGDAPSMGQESPEVRFGLATDIAAPADFTGDGKTDIAFWRPATAEWFVLRSEDASYFTFTFGQPGDIPVPADFDGDGLADAAVFRPTDGAWHTLKRSAESVIGHFGRTGDVPVPADYDADGQIDLAVYRDGEWHIRAGTGRSLVYKFGQPGDVPAPADHNGDQNVEIGVFRPSTGDWIYLTSDENRLISFRFGLQGDIPAPGDYDGDGRSDASVFRPSGPAWYLRLSTAERDRSLR